MKILLAAIALTIASTAHAQAAPAPKPEAKKCCCDKMQMGDKKMSCCDKKADSKADADAHAGHDMSKH